MQQRTQARVSARGTSPSFTRCMAAALVCLAFSVHLAAQVEPELIPAGPFRIAGMVVNAKGGNTLAHARVTIADAKHRQSIQSVITGDDGHFTFQVPAGKYSLDGQKRGFIEASYNQHDQFSTAIVTGADLDTEHLKLRLEPNAVLTGKVLDEFGEPVRTAQITVYRENHFQGISRIFRERVASTDDQGRYEVTPLEAGTYFVSAKASPWYAIHPGPAEGDSPNAPGQVDSSLDVVYPITYYGDATESEDATPVPVRGGDRLEADIHLNPLPSLHLMVHVAEDDSQGVNLPVLQKPAFDGVEQVETSSIRMVSPGVFELSGVSAGRYTVRMPDANGQMKEPTEINLSGGGELDVSTGNPTSQIKATVRVEGMGTLPEDLQIALRGPNGRATPTEIDARGEAIFADVAAGKYDVVANTATEPYSVVRIASESGNVAGHTLNVPPGTQMTISLTLRGSSIAVEGFAKRDGKAMAGAMIVLVPKDPEANLDRFRRDQSDLDGSFSLPNAMPGTYTVIAIDDGWELDWSQPAVVAQYLKRGQHVAVEGRSPSPLHLADAVEVQAK